MGRPSKYQDDFPEKMITFFSRPLCHKEIIETIHFKNGGSKDVYGFIPNDPPWFSDWCWEVGITQAIMDEWVKEESKYFKPDLFVAYNRAKELQKQFLINNCLAQRTNASMSIFTLKNVSNMRDNALVDNSKTYNIDKRSFVYLDPKAIEEEKSGTNRIKAQLPTE